MSGMKLYWGDWEYKLKVNSKHFQLDSRLVHEDYVNIIVKDNIEYFGTFPNKEKE